MRYAKVKREERVLHLLDGSRVDVVWTRIECPVPRVNREAAWNLFGKVNALPFGGFGPRSLRFDGISGMAPGGEKLVFYHSQPEWRNEFPLAEDYDQVLPGGFIVKGFELLFLTTAR